MRALVTGAGVRLGRATALALAQAGYDLILHANSSRTQVDEVAAAVRARGVQATVLCADLAASPGAFAAAALAHCDTLDLLVNNAGLFDERPFAETTRAHYQRLQALNAEAPFFLTQALLPALLRAAAPAVVNITDILAERPEPLQAAYAMSKAALLALTKALAAELGPRIRVNAVSPGAAVFPPHFDAARRAAVLAHVPLAREGTPEDIAQAVVYLASAPYVSGIVLAVDGGRFARL